MATGSVPASVESGMLNRFKYRINKWRMPAGQSRILKANYEIARSQPREKKGTVIIAAMGPFGLRTRGKVKPENFFPNFCAVLGNCGVATVYVNDHASLEKALLDSERTVLIDLANEDADDPDAQPIPADLANRCTALFNSRETGKIIRDKLGANQYLTRHGIPMPSLDLDGKRIFSNARFGAKSETYVADSMHDVDRDRYNTELIDTRVKYEGRCYHTCVRLMCIGPYMLQACVRARPTEENNPSVHTADTPADPGLLNYLYDSQVKTRMEELSGLACGIASALGEGFYAHDVLIDGASGRIFLSETNFKFFNYAYWRRVDAIAERLRPEARLMDERTYSAYAACVFLMYCRERTLL